MGTGYAGRWARKTVLIGLLAGALDVCGAPSSFEEELSQYDYRDTRKMVRAVHDAAELIAERGTNAFAELSRDSRRWNNDLFYVYVYAQDGTCLHHPALPRFEGCNLLDMTDAEGHKVLRMALAAMEDPDNPHGWVHYAWQPSGGFNPVSKSSCHFRAEMPDGRVVLVGGGMETPAEERMFARFAVDSAVRLLGEQGGAALEEIRRSDSQYRFREVRVFVLDAEGNALVDPALETSVQRNLADCADAAGHTPFAEIVEKLQENESCWEVFLQKNRYERMMEKKAIYARRGVMDGRPVIVGAAVLLPKPIWSK